MPCSQCLCVPSPKLIEYHCLIVSSHTDGYCLRNPLQRQGAVSFLVKVEKKMAWRTSWIIEALEEQWRELDGLNAET